ncbi:MAG TPA: GAF domain-containing protein, partial [Fimbriimonadaceae bacterium]|nr:GAF domain-containing protein [Fimbriimonadaceae bacterium]
MSVTAPVNSGVDPTLLLFSCAASAGSEDELLAELAGKLAEITRADGCDILLRDGGDSLVLRASILAPEYINRVRLGRGVGLCGQALMTGEALFIRRNAERYAGYAKYPGIDDQHCEAVAVLPIPEQPSEATRHLGVILLRKSTPWDHSMSLRKMCTRLSEAVSLTLTGFRRAYEAGSRSNKLGALSQVTKTISTSPYLEEILQLLVNLTAQQFDYKVCTVRLLDQAHGELVLRATQATAKAYQRKRAIKLGESMAGRAIAENRPIIVTDVQVEEDYIGHDLAVEQGLRSMICVPPTVQDRPVGVLTCYSGELRDFPPDEIKALETLAQQAAVSIEHAKLQVRSTLMQEMHHRVKNNLQQVASLLRLQLRHSHYKSLEEALHDCLSRILAISSVHDLLSREDLDHVGVRSVAETLVQHQKNSLMMPDRHIAFEVRGDDVRLNMNQATQVALVLNELIQNA